MMSAVSGVIALTGADQVVSAAACEYMGFTVRETAGARAVVRIYDNASAGSGKLLDTVSLLPNESAREYYPEPIFARSGVYVDVVSGAVEGSVRLG